MIIFPMAGLSSRFRNAGFDKPKFMLEAHGRALFDFSVIGFSGFFRREKLVFVSRPEFNAPQFVEDRCHALGLSDQDFEVVVLDRATDGQAETVALGIERTTADRAEPVTIFNIDTMRKGFEFPPQLTDSNAVGFLEVFRGEGDHWSFVDPVGDSSLDYGQASRVTEKDRISDLCSTGLYHFASANLFLDLFSTIRHTPPEELQGGERYVAPLYNQLIKAGQTVDYGVIEPNEVCFFGTPAEFESFRSSPAQVEDVLKGFGR